MLVDVIESRFDGFYGKGKAVKNCAAIIPSLEKITEMWKKFRTATTLSNPKNSNKHSPSKTCGNAMGKSIIALTILLPKNSNRDKL